MQEPSMLTAASGFAVVAGSTIALLGLVLVAALFTGGGVPVSGAGIFVLLTVMAGPVLILSGGVVVIAGLKLTSGAAWAGLLLELYCWITIGASTGWLVYRAAKRRRIHFLHVVRGGLFLLITAVPAVILLLLLRSEAVQQMLLR